MTVDGASHTERTKAGSALLKLLRNLDVRGQDGEWEVGRIGGFALTATMQPGRRARDAEVELMLERTGGGQGIGVPPDLTALGMVSRLEHALDRFDAELAEARRSLIEHGRRLTDYEPRVGGAFALAGELAARQAELAALEESLAATAKDEAGDDAPELGGNPPRLRGAALPEENEEAELEAA